MSGVARWRSCQERPRRALGEHADRPGLGQLGDLGVRVARRRAAPRRCARRAPGPGSRRGSPGVRESFTGTPSWRTGRSAPGCSISTTISRARTSSESSTSSSSSTGSRQQSCSPAKAAHSSRVRAAKIASSSRCASLPGGWNCCSMRSSRPDAAAEVAEELRLQRAERHPAVGAGVRAGSRRTCRRAGCARAAARSPSARKFAADHRQPRQRAVGHRDVDELALARAVALAQRGEDPERGHQRAAADVGDLPGRLHGRPVGLAGQAEQADEPEVVHVVARSGRAAARRGRSR